MKDGQFQSIQSDAVKNGKPADCRDKRKIADGLDINARFGHPQAAILRHGDRNAADKVHDENRPDRLAAEREEKMSDVAGAGGYSLYHAADYTAARRLVSNGGK